MGGDRLSYPVIYAENATDFFNLGLGTLPDATKVEVTEERNGEFTLSMTYLVDGLRANEIKKNRIIKVDAGHVLKGQRFVIKKINKQLVDRKMQYQVYAEHVSYITNDLQLKPKVSVSGSGDAAIKAWRSNIIDVNPLVVDSDIETNTSTSWTIDKVQSARQALGGVSGSLLDLWGGEYRFDNYHISLKKQRGTVSNTLLSYGRNITDFDQEENITDTYTSVYPYATYTETTENSSDSESKLLTLPELTIDSKYVGNYPNRKILPVDLTAKFAAGEKPTEAKLREFAKSYVTANDIGVPKVSIKLSFVDLSQSSNYEALQLLEVLDLCDTVPVRFTKLGVDTKTKVSRVVWNVLADHYTSMELGDTRYTIGDMINNALNTANEANQNSQEAQNSANHAVLSADGHTMIFYGPGTPSAKNIGDLWYKPDGEYEILYRWDGKVWSFVMSTRDTAEAKDAADKAAKEADEAKKQANDAVGKANQAVTDAGFANDTADQAKTDAATALQKALDAYAHGDQIKNGLTVDLDAVKGQVALKASQIDVDKLGGRVTSAEAQIKLQADQIALSVSKTELTNVLGSYATQTWTQGQIKTEADKINLSVSKVQSNLDGLQIGGTNYVRNGNLAFQSNNWRAWGASDGATRAINNAGADWPANTPGLIKLIKPNKAGQFGYAQDGIAVTPSTTYTVSLLAQAAAGTEITIQTGDGSGDIWQHKAIKLNGGKERVYFTMTTSKTASKTNVYLGFNEGQIGTVWISRIMMVAGNKPMDWAQNPADYASEVQFSQLQLTVNGIQGTVQDKADKSQVTQLANQITSTVTDMTAYNLITNTEFEDRSLSTWGFANSSFWSVGWNSADAYMGSNVLHFRRTSTQTQGWTDAGSNWIEVYPGQIISASCIMYQTGPTGDGWTPTNNFQAEIDFYASKTSGRIAYHGSNKFNIAQPYVKQTLKVENITVPEGANYVRFHIQTNGNGNVIIAHPMLVKRSYAGIYVSGKVSQSQITQLSTDINLRVQKGDVINQINISPESILIAGQKVHITGKTSIDNAVIKDAMIANIKADKITAGTLNAANVNVINLNANNITTGTLKGANLSMNLNTGQVVFQKGYITSADGRIRFDLDSNYFRSLDYNNNGFEAKDGQFVWYSNWSGNTKNEIGRVMFDVLSEGNGGIAIQGKTGASLITNQAGIYVGTGGLNDKPDGIGISGNAFFWGNLDVMGKKNAVHVTSKGVVETPAYETAESYLGDIGESITDEYGSALIHIDDLFNQIINTDHDYQVFISSYSNAVVWVEKRNKTSFEVHSNIPNAKFAWEVKAKRRGYETDRLVKSEMKYEQLNKFHEKKVSA